MAEKKWIRMPNPQPPDRALCARDVGKDPHALFARWYAEAADALADDFHAANTLTLATVGADGRPSARVVLLKKFDREGLVFFTRYTSRKGRELAANPVAAAVMYWAPLGRQVRFVGRVETLPPEESDAYFASRNRDSQLGAHASLQSQPLGSREEFQKRFDAAAARFADGPIPRPEDWGGYRLRPEEIEFWQGRLHRLHDRFLFLPKADGSWARQRLSP